MKTAGLMMIYLRSNRTWLLAPAKSVIVIFVFFMWMLLPVGLHAERMKAVGEFNISRYLGRWYEIGRFDHAREKGVGNIFFVFAEDDDVIRMANYGLRHSDGGLETMKARIREKEEGNGDGAFEVSLFWPFWADLNVVWIDDGYSLSVASVASLDFLWILARAPQVERELLERCIDGLKAMGIDVSRIIWTDQEDNIAAYQLEESERVKVFRRKYGDSAVDY